MKRRITKKYDYGKKQTDWEKKVKWMKRRKTRGKFIAS